MDDLRGQIRELQERDNGQSVDQDIEACLGYLKVLKKKRTRSKKAVTLRFPGAKNTSPPSLITVPKKEVLLAKIK